MLLGFFFLCRECHEEIWDVFPVQEANSFPQKNTEPPWAFPVLEEENDWPAYLLLLEHAVYIL